MLLVETAPALQETRSIVSAAASVVSSHPMNSAAEPLHAPMRTFQRTVARKRCAMGVAQSRVMRARACARHSRLATTATNHSAIKPFGTAAAAIAATTTAVVTICQRNPAACSATT